MGSRERTVRQSVSLPLAIVRRIRNMAAKRNASANRVLVDLIDAGLRSNEAEKEYFFALANRLADSPNPTERRRIKKELARLTFERA